MGDPVSTAFLGRGWSFPVTPRADGVDVELVAYDEDVRQAVLLILETAPGERVMRPDFGSGLHTLVFEPLNTTTMALATHRVETALTTWEPRIALREVTVTADGAIRNRLNIEIEYQVRATNTFYNLVFPFYLQESGE